MPMSTTKRMLEVSSAVRISPGAANRFWMIGTSASTMSRNGRLSSRSMIHVITLSTLPPR